MRLFSRSLSVLLHPLWMPTFTVLLCYYLDPRLSFAMVPLFRWWVCLIVFLMTGVFPLTSTLVMVRGGVINGLSMPQRRERIPVYLVTLLYYGMGYWVLRRIPLHPLMLAVVLGAATALALCLLITLRWKISAHMVGIGGLLGALFAVVFLHHVPATLVLSLVLLLAGLLGTARLWITDHTPAQIYSGALLGLCCVFVMALTAPMG